MQFVFIFQLILILTVKTRSVYTTGMNKVPMGADDTVVSFRNHKCFAFFSLAFCFCFFVHGYWLKQKM